MRTCRVIQASGKQMVDKFHLPGRIRGLLHRASSPWFGLLQLLQASGRSPVPTQAFRSALTLDRSSDQTKLVRFAGRFQKWKPSSAVMARGVT
jgi:hypothetical protein